MQFFIHTSLEYIPYICFSLITYSFLFIDHYNIYFSIDKIKENGFKLTKERGRRYHVKIVTDADYALLVNAPAQAETQLHSLERAAAGISLHVNAHKTEYMCFNQTGDISTLTVVL